MAFPWRDPTTGDTFELPFIPQSRDELERMLVEMRAQKAAEVQAPTGRFAEDIGPALTAASKSAPGQALDWLMNAPVLKGVADKLRAPGGREAMRAIVPGFEMLEAVPGLIGAGGAAIGAGMDQPLEDVPDLSGIIQREAEEGLPSAMEMVAPIDLATAGLGAASAGARAIPRLARAAAPLAKAATAADIFEGIFGGGQAVHGAATGDPLEAGVGLARLAGGTAAALPGRLGGVDVGAAARQGLEDVAPYVERTARDMGYTDNPLAASWMAEPGGPKGPKVDGPFDVSDLGEIKPPELPSRPEVPAGHRRYYRGGEGSSFFTENEPRAGSYAGEEGGGHFVDVPDDQIAGFQAEAAKQGQPTPQDIYLPDEWVKKAQPTTLKRETFDVEDLGDTGTEELFSELGVTRPKEAGPEVVGGEELPGPKTADEIFEQTIGEGSKEGVPSTTSTIPLLDTADATLTKPFNPVQQIQEGTRGPGIAPKPANAVQRGVAGVQGEAPPGALGVGHPAGTDAAGLIQSEVAPLKDGALEGAPPPKKGQTFAEFMQAKFGDKATTSKERAIARAEWEKVKSERKMLKLAEAAGVPPDKLKAMLEGAPKEGGPEAGSLSRWRRAALPVIENFETVHPWLKKQFTKYVDEAEAPAMKNIADSYRIKESLSKPEQRMVVDILDGKKVIDETTPGKVRQAAVNYRAMLDQTWSDAVVSGTRKAADRKRATYFPHKFAEGWDDNLVQNLHMDKNWNLRESSLEKARLSKRADYRRDLDVLDEYFLSAYRRISEVQNFGKRLEILRRFAKKHVTDKETAEWLQTNVRRVMGREHPGGFERFAGHARHVQALSDLGFAAFYQPVQATNTALYGGLGRSMRALQVIARDAPNEVYDAIRSRALVPDITQELVAGAYGAREGIPSRALQKFMWGIPTIDKWTRIHANTVGKLMVGDAMKGSKGAIKDIKALGFDVNNLADLQKVLDTDPDFGLKVGKELSDKALFRSGAMELPGWTSSTAGKLSTQYTRFMYRHSLFIRDIFGQAAKGNVRPLARFLTVAPVVITGMAEVLYPIREGLREALREGITKDEDIELQKVKDVAFGDESTWEDEIQWMHVLRNKRIPWSHPLKHALQNISMWGGIGVFQMAAERVLGATGSPIEVGAKALTGPVPGNLIEATGSVIKDVNRLPQDVEWDETPFPNTRRWGAQQIPIAGYPIARRMRDEFEE